MGTAFAGTSPLTINNLYTRRVNNIIYKPRVFAVDFFTRKTEINTCNKVCRLTTIIIIFAATCSSHEYLFSFNCSSSHECIIHYLRVRAANDLSGWKWNNRQLITFQRVFLHNNNIAGTVSQYVRRERRRTKFFETVHSLKAVQCDRSRSTSNIFLSFLIEFFVIK